MNGDLAVKTERAKVQGPGRVYQWKKKKTWLTPGRETGAYNAGATQSHRSNTFGPGDQACLEDPWLRDSIAED